MVSCFLWCLRSDLHKILQEGRPLDQRGWKISKLWLPWQPLPWQPENLPRAHKTPKRLWRSGIGWEENCCHDFMLPWQLPCFHGNQKCTIGQSVRKKCVKNMSQCCHQWPGWHLVALWHHAGSHWRHRTGNWRQSTRKRHPGHQWHHIAIPDHFQERSRSRPLGSQCKVYGLN